MAIVKPPDAADRDLVVAVLRAAGDQRARAARAAAVEVEAQRRAAGNADGVRPAALRITRTLAEAGRLAELADDLANGDVVLVEPTLRGGDPDDAPEPAEPQTRATLRVVGPPAEPDKPKATPKEPTDAQADAAVADAERILDEAFGAGTTEIPEDGPIRYVLPPGQGDDDDPDPSVDVAALDGFDAAVTLEPDA